MKKLERRKPKKKGGWAGSDLRRPRRRICKFCAAKVTAIDYKDIGLLRNFLSDRAKIMPRRISGTCSRHQRTLAVAVKRSRLMGLLPYAVN